MVNLFPQMMDKLRPGWRNRAEHKKSFWNIIQLFLTMTLLITIWWNTGKISWEINKILYPAHKGIKWISPQLNRLAETGNAHIGFMVLIFAPLPLAILLSGIVSNLLFWLIKPAQKTFEKEAAEAQDPTMTFKGSMRPLSIVTLIAIPITLALLAIGIHLIK